MIKRLNKWYLLLVLILVIGLVFYLVHGRSHTASVIPSSNNTDHPTTITPATTSSGVQASPKNQAVGGGGQSGKVELLEPGGTFVSNHRPKLSGSAQQKSEQSVCITSPGAVCYIEFKQGSVVHKLAAEQTNSNGTAYWTWNLDNSGLGAGTWQVSAVAILGDQTKTAVDPISLEIGQ